jgi:hypothetical protein
MKYFWALLVAALSITGINAAHAQQLAVAQVVSACGTVSPTPSIGGRYPLTIDITGTLCSVAGGGGSGGTSSSFGAAFPGSGTAAGFEYLSSPPTLTSGQMVAGQTDVNGNLKVSPSTATLWGLLAQGATTSGQLGELMLGAVTTAAPTYTTAQSSPLSLDASGNLRVNVVTGGGTGGTSSTFGAAYPSTGTAAGYEYLSAAPTLTNGQMVAGQTDVNGNLNINTPSTSNLASILNWGSVTTSSSAGSNGVLVMGKDSAGNAQPAAATNNITPTACSGTITTGGTAQNAITAQTTLHGFTIANIDPSAGSGEPLWISFTTTAAASGTDSWPLPAPTATTFAAVGSYTTPPGFGSNHAVSIIAATTGHKFSCVWW